MGRHMGRLGGGLGSAELFHNDDRRLLLDVLARLARSEASVTCSGGGTEVFVGGIVDGRQNVILRVGLFCGFEVALFVLRRRWDAGNSALLAGRGVTCLE
jgi:hypothetical protein